MKTLFKNHRIIAKPWQLEAADKNHLQKIILPLTGELVSEEIACNDIPVKFKVGDRIFLAKEWSEHSEGTILKSLHSSRLSLDKGEIWRPAESMPEGAAEYCFTIQKVSVMEARTLSPQDFVDGGLYPKDFHHLDCFETRDACEQASKRLNDAYHFWKNDGLVVVLDIALEASGESNPPQR